MARKAKKIHPADLHTLKHVPRAVAFTVFRVRGRGANRREEHPTLDAARDSAKGDSRALVYAITPEGWTIHVPAGYAP